MFSTVLLFACIAGASAVALDGRATGGYVQSASGTASFTGYSGCKTPGTCNIHTSRSPPPTGVSLYAACGKGATGFTAAINQLAFGSGPGLGSGDACGRCFSLTATADPFSPAYTGPFKSIVVKDTGGAGAFFPPGHGALTGTFTEVSCSKWSGSDGAPLWNGACLSGESTGNWPATGCGNKGREF
ncbi:hypothetical protein H0H81_011870 [Sphagnurus paluster]|uniref:Cellulase n=1 Tax=Sphagnurus paluster TaxID=117069 RepID=A0A9P7GIB1_9AGAR|nr:hypothetical protein H0H81_011870 [Sphagnurus paluster]